MMYEYIYQSIRLDKTNATRPYQVIISQSQGRYLLVFSKKVHLLAELTFVSIPKRGS